MFFQLLNFFFTQLTLARQFSCYSYRSVAMATAKNRGRISVGSVVESTLYLWWWKPKDCEVGDRWGQVDRNFIAHCVLSVKMEGQVPRTTRLSLIENLFYYFLVLFLYFFGGEGEKTYECVPRRTLKIYEKCHHRETLIMFRWVIFFCLLFLRTCRLWESLNYD